MRHGLVPIVLYGAGFAALTFPLLRDFSTRFFFFPSSRDGLQTAWNLWWVDQALRHPELHPSIWHTNLLHWPYGTTLVGHALTPFNGFLAVVLLRFMSLLQTYNAVVVFSFVMGGVTMYWLAYAITHAYWPSILAGFLFTFSSYHFAHTAGGHLHLVSLEWMPLFLLCWYWLLERPSSAAAAAAAAALWLVFLCNLYDFFYCVLTALIMLLWHAAATKNWRVVLRRDYVAALVAFASLCALLMGPLLLSLVLTNAHDPFLGSHRATAFSLDLLALLIPGENWRFNRWTAFYWSKLPGNFTESTVYLSLPVLASVVYVWMRRRRLDAETQAHVALWSIVMGVFFLLALGPALHVGGTVVWDRLMPYTVLVGVAPFLSLSGVPVRMAVMVALSAALLSAIAWKDLVGHLRRARWAAWLLVAIVLLQSWPRLPGVRAVEVPEYVKVLAELPGGGGVLDLVEKDAGLQLYYQTVHRKPIAFGYLARLPISVRRKDAELGKAFADHETLRDTYRIQYLVRDREVAIPDEDGGLAAPLYEKNGVRIYRLGRGEE